MALAYLKGVATLNLDRQKCNGCGICVEVCPHDVFLINSNKDVTVAFDACMECGACALNCPFGALTLTSGVGCAKALIRRRAWKRQENKTAACSGAAASGEAPRPDCCDSPKV